MDLYTATAIYNAELEYTKRRRETLANSGWYDVEREEHRPGLFARMSAVMARRWSHPVVETNAESEQPALNITHLILAREREQALRIAEQQPVQYLYPRTDDDDWAA